MPDSSLIDGNMDVRVVVRRQWNKSVSYSECEAKIDDGDDFDDDDDVKRCDSMMQHDDMMRGQHDEPKR